MRSMVLPLSYLSTGLVQQHLAVGTSLAATAAVFRAFLSLFKGSNDSVTHRSTVDNSQQQGEQHHSRQKDQHQQAQQQVPNAPVRQSVGFRHLPSLQQHPWSRKTSSYLHTATSGTSDAQGPKQQSQGSSSSSAEQSKAITRLMRDASSISQLRGVVSQHSSAFNAINLAAAFSRASHILTDQQQQQQQQSTVAVSKAAAAAAADVEPLLQELSALWQQQLQLATPRELASVLIACSKLALFDPALWSSTVMALLRQQNEANSQDASSATYALASAAAANGGAVPGLTQQQLTDAVLTLATRVHRIVAAASSSSGSRGSDRSGRQRNGAPIAAQAISNLLWSLARLEIQLPMHELVGLLQGLADPRVLASASPLALVNTLWALSELQQLPAWGRNAESASGGTRASLAGGKQQQQQQPPVRVIPHELLSEQQSERLAKSTPQGVSNAVLALSRFASGPQPHLLEVPVAQSCIRQLLQGPTAATLSMWNAQDVGNAVYAAAQVGVIENTFLQAVMAAAPQWLPDAGPATVAQVALGFARLKLRHHSDFLEALVLRGKQLLLQHDHHQHHNQQQQTAADPSSISSSSQEGNAQAQAAVETAGQQQQQQHMCECLATDLSWSIAVLNHQQLAREIAQLIRASGIKQEYQLHPKNARRLWTVHAWLDKHKLVGGHGLQRLLTEQQLAFCAAASRHTFRMTPPASVVNSLQGTV